MFIFSVSLTSHLTSIFQRVLNITIYQFNFSGFPEFFQKNFQKFKFNLENYKIFLYRYTESYKLVTSKTRWDGLQMTKNPIFREF